MKNNIVVILPTYNESLNIEKTLDSILGVRKKLKAANLSVLVVDDNSPDGTAQIVSNYTKAGSSVFLLKNKSKNGIGAAYLKGFEYAIKNLDADILFEMDADHSHRAEDILQIYNKMSQGFDMVIGSRYLDKSYISGDWPKYRFVNSKICNFAARHFAGIHKIKDCTSGFRALKKEVANRIIPKLINVNSYSFQIISLYFALKMKYKVGEVPIRFYNRKNGNSKMSIGDTLELILHAVKFRFLIKIP